MRKKSFFSALCIWMGAILALTGCDLDSEREHTNLESEIHDTEVLDASDGSEEENDDESNQSTVIKNGYRAIRCENCSDHIFSTGTEIIDKIKTDTLDNRNVSYYSGLNNIGVSDLITIYKDKNFVFVIFYPQGGMSQLNGGEMYSTDGGNTWYIRDFHRVCSIGDMYIIDGKILEIEGIGLFETANAFISYNYGETYISLDCSEIEKIIQLPEMIGMAYPKVSYIDIVNDEMGFDWYVLGSATPFYHMDVSISTFETLDTEDICGLSGIAEKYNAEEYIFEESNVSYLNEAELRQRYSSAYTATQQPDVVADGIRYAINEIYAKKGYDFTGTSYEHYFTQKDWYEPIPGKVVEEGELNKYEKANIDLLAWLEKEYQELASDN